MARVPVRRVLPPVLLAVSALASLGLLATPSGARPKAGPHLDFRRTYADALLEARARNVPVFVSRHKDD